MADFETDEQQVEALKEWWAKNGKMVIGGAIIGFGAIFGVQSWTQYKQTQGEAASIAFTQLSASMAAANINTVVQHGEQIINTYPSSIYAALSALMMAKAHVDLNDLAAAHSSLQWVVDNSDQADLISIARLRMARVLLADDKANLALTILNQHEGSAYQAMVEEIRGDIHIVLGDVAQARVDYKAALDALLPDDDRSVLKMKLDNLGV